MPCDAIFRVPTYLRALWGTLARGLRLTGVSGLCSQIKIYYI